MDRLEAVADVGQGARHDDAHRVVEVAHPHLVLDADRRMSPRSSVTLDQASGGGQASGGSGWLAGSGSSPKRARSRRRPTSTVRPDRLRMPASRVRRSPAVAGSSLAEGVADDPGAMAVVRRGGAIGLDAQGGLGGRRRPRRPASDTPRTAPSGRPARRRPSAGRGAAAPALATSGSRPRRRSTWVIVAIVDPTSRRSQRDGLIDELLELRPAIRLGRDPLAVRMGQRVDGDPVAGLAGGAPEELPGPLGLGRRASARGCRRRTSGLRARSRGRADRRRTAAAVGRSPASRPGSRARPRRGAASGRRGRPRCRARPAAARRGSRGRRGPRGPAASAAAKASGSLDQLGEARCRAPLRPARCAATKATARAVAALAGGRVGGVRGARCCGVAPSRLSTRRAYRRRPSGGSRSGPGARASAPSSAAT